MFIDYAEIEVNAGSGGNGAVAFRREKFVPKGGPAGGNGGRGGNVVVAASENLHTLLDFRYKRNYKAQNGQPGGNSLKDGKSGKDIVIKVPVGTVIKEKESNRILFDLDKNGKKIILAKGGRGGKGNSKFATATNQAPRYAEPGQPGESKKIILELKLIADVGLVGFPNAGKSTLISKISAAKPKIADYPFTTLKPNLGIVKYKDYKSFTVADIPGIIEGAHEGKGLGLRFLRHIERTRILLFMIEITSQDYEKDFEVLENELSRYSPALSKKHKLICLSKADLVQKDELKKTAGTKIKNIDSPPLLVSSVTGFGIPALIDQLWDALNKVKND